MVDVAHLPRCHRPLSLGTVEDPGDSTLALDGVLGVDAGLDSLPIAIGQRTLPAGWDRHATPLPWGAPLFIR